MARSQLSAPTSAEAELLLLQRQALVEEEQAKVKRALLTRFMQEKLSREEQSSLWGLHKVRTLWRSAQRKAKDKELRQDIEILSQTFSRVMDCKDGTIEVTLGALHGPSEQGEAVRMFMVSIQTAEFQEKVQSLEMLVCDIPGCLGLERQVCAKEGRSLP
nr:dynein regulatory complex subunit 2-like [Zonotrichia albicollis]